jgi:O-antigen/teichoic acid export membrane protein
VVKSVVGVIATFVFSVWLIPMWMLNGAVAVNLAANIVVFMVLMFAYLRDGAKK